MNPRPNLPPPPPSIPPTSKSPTECCNCGNHNCWVLHNIRLRAANRRLCTSCVLRLHPASFCPSCFQFYDPSVSPHPSNRLACVKCSSITHSHCVVNSASSSSSSSDPQMLSSSYLCPPCANPNYCFFELDSGPRGSTVTVDRKISVVLLCAAKIASASMAKALALARADADRKVREAAVAKKRAREAIEHVGFVMARERARRMEEEAVAMEVSGSGSVGVKENERNRNVGSMVKVENSVEAPVVPCLNAGCSSSGLSQRRESLNGFVRQISMVKNEGAVSMEEDVRQKNVEADRLQRNNNIADNGNDNGNDNGEVENVQNDHIGGNVNTTS